MIADRDFSHAEEYLEKLSEPEERVETRIGIPSLDYLIQVKVSAASAQRIEVQEEYNGNFPEPDAESIMDWCVLLGNLWDNALEGCSRVDGSRWIRFSLRYEGGAMAVKMKNSCPANLDTKRLFSSKNDCRIHGIGIKNMEQVVAKYDGTMEQECNDNIFMTRIIIIL